MKLFLLPLAVLLFLAENGKGGRDESLYDILGVSRKADQKEIRSAYKKLARVWHPDKNKSPRAQEKILEINKAYEVLSGEGSRRHYDMTGEIDPAPSGSQDHTHNRGFTVFQTGNGHFQFQFGGGGFGHTHQHKDTITTHYFRSAVLPESSSKVFLLNFFSDFCMQCGEVARIWDELREEMQSYNVGIGSVHASYHHDITHYCGVDRVPTIVAIVDKRAFHYHGHLQARSIRNFVKSTIPAWTVAELNSRNTDDFISNSIMLNKPRILLFSPHPQPSLLYKSVAFSSKHLADFAFVSTDRASGNSLEFLQQFKVSWRMKKLLVFKEYPTPSITIEESQLSNNALRSVVQGTKLHLPRLSSARVMDSTCGNDGRMCLVLVVSGIDSYNDTITAAFRALAVKASMMEDRADVRMAYIDEEKQGHFVSALQRTQVDWKYCPSGKEARRVILLKRKTGFHTLYDWFYEFCDSEGDREKLFSLASKTGLKYSTILPKLEDEFAPGVLSRVWHDAVEIWYQVYDYFSTANSHTLSLLAMMCCMAMMMCCVSMIGASQSTEEERRKRTSRKPCPHPNATDATPTSHLSHLSTQLYRDHVEHAHKGSITVLLLSNSVGNDLVAFSETAKKHKSQRFSFFRSSLQIHRPWLRDLLEASNMETQDKERRQRGYFGEKNVCTSVCVLALFGAKKQLAIFPEKATSKSHMTVSSNHLSHSSGSLVNGETERNTSGDMIDTFLSSFGFQDEDSDTREEFCNHNERKSSHFWASNTQKYSGRGSGTLADGDGCRPDSSGEDSCREESSYRGDEDTAGPGRRQGRRGFGVRLAVWMERLEDGSLKRYTVDHWPPWQENL